MPNLVTRIIYFVSFLDGKRSVFRERTTDFPERPWVLQPKCTPGIYQMYTVKSEFDYRKEQEISSLKRADRLAPSHAIIQQTLFPRGQDEQGIKLTSRLYTVQTL